MLGGRCAFTHGATLPQLSKRESLSLSKRGSLSLPKRGSLSLSKRGSLSLSKRQLYTWGASTATSRRLR
ncbi:protein of unknown function [Microbacterium sp. Nx66]|nr:protein of unknown function [Microbacterium sp. Nx66]